MSDLEFPEKYLKLLDTDFKLEAEAASDEDLKKIIVNSENSIYSVDKEKAADDKLNGAKALVKDYMAPYNEAVRRQTAKIKYALYLLDAKGALGTGED